MADSSQTSQTGQTGSRHQQQQHTDSGHSVHGGPVNGSQNGGSEGRRNRGNQFGRRRGRGQSQAASSRRGNAPPADGQRTNVLSSNASTAIPVSGAPSGVPSETPLQGGAPPFRPGAREYRGRGRGRGRGGARGRGGISAAHTSAVVSARSFGGRLTGSEATGFNVNAAEFVPGQPPALPAGTSTGDIAKAAGKAPGRKVLPSTADDLTTRTHEDIDSGNYDCCICLNPVLRSSRFWTCTICWRVTHFSCVSKWLKQKRQDDVITEEFVSRCPACNSELPEGTSREKHCWCGKQKNHSVAPISLPPHSCGRVCGKTRGKCPHPCPAVCHAGPCPPCKEMGPAILCYCGKHASTLPCTETKYSESWSCQEVCESKLPCGIHKCARICHPDGCGDCITPMPSICYCGKTRKGIPCNQRETVLLSYDYGQLAEPPDGERPPGSKPATFEGCFRCDSVCARPFDCGAHVCKKPCHQQKQEPVHCPLSPDVVTHCPCGKTPLSALSAKARTSCQDEIPKCGKTCDKILPCKHRCMVKCHDESCPPCEQIITLRCRCGRTETDVVCGSADSMGFQCDNICRTLFNCGQHKCRSICCAGRERAIARQAAAKGRSGQRNQEFETEHICLLICGRPLKCGKHTCPQLCHRGACLSCTESIMEEMRCACGRTVLYPPLPCGTQLPTCQFDCTRSLSCGHPTVAHRCHDDSQPCPRCPQLVSKTCLCGKFTLKKVACGTGDLTCEKICGKTLKCQIHQCRKPCHRPGECEDEGPEASECSQSCGRERPTCGHPCTFPCHGSSECSEDEPCRSRVVITCECQRRKQEVRCLVSKTNPSPAHASLSCDDECRRQQRNAAMKSALQVPDSHEDDHMPYSSETMGHFRQYRVWAQEQEQLVRAFAENPEERRLNFKPMISSRRAFLHMLAEDFGLDSQSQDPEPHRHVSYFKTPRFVSAPTKTLAQCDVLQKKIREKEREQAALEAGEIAKLYAVKTAPRHPFNAILLPARLADQAVVNPDVLSDLLPFLEQSEALSVRQTRFESVPQASGEIVMKAIAPAAAPAGIERLLRALLPYIEGLTSGQDGAADPVRVCYVDADMKVVRRDGDELSSGGASGGAGGDAGQWNVVASRVTRRTGPGADTATANTPSRRGRALFTLKKASTSANDAAERQRRMDILAQAPADVEEAQEETQEETPEQTAKETPEETQEEIKQVEDATDMTDTPVTADKVDDASVEEPEREEKSDAEGEASVEANKDNEAKEKSLRDIEGALTSSPEQQAESEIKAVEGQAA